MQSDQLIMEENGKRYRMLQVGETLEAGDEVNHSGKWHKYSMKYGASAIRKDDGGAMPVGYYRRPIQ